MISWCRLAGIILRSFRLKSLELGPTELLKEEDWGGGRKMFPQMIILVLVFAFWL